MYLIFDTETTGLPQNYNAPLTDFDNWPRVVQIAWQLHDASGKLVSNNNLIVKPEGFEIPFNAEKIHGISTKRALEEGLPLEDVLQQFNEDLARCEVVVGHNIEFDINIMGCEYLRKEIESPLTSLKSIDTKNESTEYCAIPGGRGGKFKWPTLTELHKKLFGVGFDEAHDAAYDVAATTKCFFGLITEKVIKPLDGADPASIVYEEPKLAAANFAQKEDKGKTPGKTVAVDIKGPFCHLHVHSQFSILPATADIKKLVSKAKEYDMPAVALTDLGNMFGAFKFVREAHVQGIKPIVGCEFYVSEDRKTRKFTKDNPDRMTQQVLLAKNKDGYHNLIKLSSLGYMEGLYGLYPRIDKELIMQYSKNLIALSGNLSSEIPNTILNQGESQGEELFKWWVEVFGDDFYVELIRHGLPEENHVNEVLLGLAAKYNTKVIAANDVFYTEKADADAHDILLCVKDGQVQSTPKGAGRGNRFGFPNDQFYFKSEEEMKKLFADVPEAIENIGGLLEKIESYKLDRNVLLPAFPIPEGFETEDDYLRHLTLEGAKKRYKEISQEIQERLDFELETIKKTGYPGYFLIVQDFTSEARKMGVSVGPGRGSAAGSAVAYCIGITNVDPIKYDLLFERFLNPDRVSLPDIDIDFDDEGRGKIIEWVVNKYGKNQVAQIITYGTMAAKSSIRDSARVMELPLSDADILAKLVPERPGTSLTQAFREVPELMAFKNGKDLKAQVLQKAAVIEGTVRNTGIHACGIIITPDDLTNHVPVSTAKDSDLLVTQFDNSVVESAGMLKMDFLGLKTLSIIKTAIENIRLRHGITIDPDEIPLDDAKTFELYQKGQTNGTFQFESPGMQKHLRNLKPDRLEDLIAMNALYRPGPLEYIPNFIARKLGKEVIAYDLPEMEDNLKETYGITVYQEQVMLLSQKLAGFTKGEADVLRKAMGKKQREVLDKMKGKFVEGATKKGHPKDKLDKIWKDWEAFAQYAFNKSHSTCYSVVAYHTAYLKANYPAEYMSAVLTHNQSSIEKVSFFMEECRNLGLPVLGPHVNESRVNFAVNKKGEIRFGLGAIKGAGEAAVQSIIEEREKNGPFQDIWDFGVRVVKNGFNKKTFECLAMSGAFDCFEEYHRRQYLEAADGESTLVELITKYSQRLQQEAASDQVSLFGGSGQVEVPKPRIPDIEPFGDIRKLNIEKEVVGLYISGHPLDQFSFEMKHFCNTTLTDLKNDESLANGGIIRLGGIVSGINHRTTKKGNPFGVLTLEDYSDSYEFFMFSDTYVKFKQFYMVGWYLFVEGFMQPSKFRVGELEFKISEIQLLNDIRDKMAKGLILKLDVNNLTEQMIDDLHQMAIDHAGSCPLKVVVQDPSENISLELFSRKLQVEPKGELIKQLDAVGDLEYEVMT
ncbi:MAG: DNA polymerase III subunit alpha [Imperialibacter sp.]|uniref:DNA polymerase III subunit alpha n=1 Tax=Imperialibacter sp. TaxID=2038411 RepID=UPI0032EDA713